tara:strand:- start:1125 stop:1337 length:213 start_codon:yes stop_codon:yes gene_type:complete
MKPTDYMTLLNTLELKELGPFSSAQDVERAVALVDNLPHWFDRQRAIAAIAERVEVEAELICRMMTRGKV